MSQYPSLCRPDNHHLIHQSKQNNLLNLVNAGKLFFILVSYFIEMNLVGKLAWRKVKDGLMTGFPCLYDMVQCSVVRRNFLLNSPPWHRAILSSQVTWCKRQCWVSSLSLKHSRKMNRGIASSLTINLPISLCRLSKTRNNKPTEYKFRPCLLRLVSSDSFSRLPG